MLYKQDDNSGSERLYVNYKLIANQSNKNMYTNIWKL